MSVRRYHSFDRSSTLLDSSLVLRTRQQRHDLCLMHNFKSERTCDEQSTACHVLQLHAFLSLYEDDVNKSTC